MKKVILASASPRRSELLSTLIGPNFEIIVSSYDEKEVEDLAPAELVMHHSREKAIDVAGKLNEGIIISADTVVVYDGTILGKPDDKDDARRMLKALSGQQIQVISGITVMDVASGSAVTEHESTDIWMRQISDSLISKYISTGETEGKAGAFAIQGKGAILVQRIEGDFFNVVGLPLYRLSKMLDKFGINVLDYSFGNGNRTK
ncbi:MAG: nucleoside triphosphate pyrophosphatase [Methanolobus sp.]|jgi:septum formation protein|uniref:Maf family nucleotide pyrophosphatase n=1 Tax=Methanolobus sp. TaxID=1874737 RepID=UPI00258DB34C|nr:Maf family nucleotide pyrophosphatase [Methanolobus sp.]MDK2830349.1 nucleoside triphosphate pyrophosphatase [Methanolobus sp.]MDK2939142.1 nucleoside triphosphate pyrophosphatase [Methanolobus sp.]